ncbi:alpha-1-antiproteinase-like isoform X2 [Dendropsophus ebraccatus]|uniref:alpha-1-antiproteinase-like isoform X2 n=1 Tax=Dendropsophus ebraccatus TaxID=150705 RepID=UPI003831BD6B
MSEQEKETNSYAVWRLSGHIKCWRSERNMRAPLILLAVALFTLAFADHEDHNRHDKDDHHDHSCSHYQKGEKDDRKHQHPHNELLPCQKIAPYNSEFSFALYRQVALDHPSENIVFCPVTISIAFAFLPLSANSKTHSQIIERLGFNPSEISEKEMAKVFDHLLYVLSNVNRDVQLYAGNALFISKEHKILQTFLDDAKRLFDSDVFPTDFKNTEEAKNLINSYIKKNTDGEISKLLDSVDQDAIMVLINYMYLPYAITSTPQGKWKKSLDKKEGDFHVSESTTVKVPFMVNTGWHNVAFTDEATVVSIPYNEDANALFILPRKGKFSEVEQNFNEELLIKWKKSMHTGLLKLVLPKFNISSTINLKETLSKMGLADIFSDTAGLSAITEEANMKISTAVHKTVLRVDEINDASFLPPTLPPLPLPLLIAFNRPFMLCFYDQKTRSVLLAGRIVNPQK